MRCRYKFKVNGKVKPAAFLDFVVQDYKFEFVIDNEFIKYLCISFPVTKKDIPRLRDSNQPGIKLHMNLTSPRLYEIEKIVRQIEGFWSIFGVKSIDVLEPEIEWIPENDEDRNELKLYSYKLSSAVKDEDIGPIPFDLLARPIIASVQKKQHDLVLSFYRRGLLDMNNQEYIEAIYDFYFILESAYGEGKTKNIAIEKSFINSEELIQNISQVKYECEHGDTIGQNMRPKYNKEYLNYSPQEWVKKFVKLRGFLHHHNSKNRGIWDPGKQKSYHLEAYILLNICHKYILSIFSNEAYSFETEKVLFDIYKENGIPIPK